MVLTDRGGKKTWRGTFSSTAYLSQIPLGLSWAQNQASMVIAGILMLELCTTYVSFLLGLVSKCHSVTVNLYIVHAKMFQKCFSKF
jgi:hypothetical protein